MQLRIYATFCPSVESPKEQVTLRLDADIIEAFKAAGAGWQTRMNEALRHVIKRCSYIYIEKELTISIFLGLSGLVETEETT